MTNAAPPGWYPDQSNPAFEHWWNGTTYVQSRPTPFAAQPPVQYAPYGYPPAAQYGGRVSPKSRTVAAVLGFFLGGLGVDRFYLGNIGMGVAKLLVGWLTLGIWPLIDWIIILVGSAHDGQGLPVTNWS
jgi:hypothetical protein